MIKYKVTCSRCGNTWEEETRKYHDKRLPYTMTKFIAAPGSLINAGRYENIDLCPACMDKLIKFMNNESVDGTNKTDGYYVVKDVERGIDILADFKRLGGYFGTGLSIVTLESYLDARNKEKENK